MLTDASKDVHEHVEAEAVQVATQEVIQSRLCEAEARRRLSDVQALDVLTDLRHQLGAELQVFGLLKRVAQGLPHAVEPLAFAHR